MVHKGDSVLQWIATITPACSGPERRILMIIPMDYPYSAPTLRMCNSDGTPSEIPFMSKHEWSPFSCALTLFEEMREAISVNPSNTRIYTKE